ncbi:MAG: hypothetical protein NC337_04180 [Roseburia sp.]|nr:hypothetical protein [Roseburia sp.]
MCASSAAAGPAGTGGRSAVNTDRKSKGQTNRIWTIVLLALVLLLYPLRHVRTGADLMDAGYALGNYRFFDVLGRTWKLATYLANVLGVALSHLPMGNTWIGMNVYTGLLVGLTAASVYVFLAGRYARRKRGYSVLLFAAELTALSLCWAPTVILYHYLGYMMMTAASLVLFCAITGDSRRDYIIAGVILGLCVAVRMPNITYMAFILPVWYFFFLNRRDYESAFKTALSRTGLCIAGYLAGLLPPLLVIGLRYGFGAYPEMIGSLFGMTETATDYKPVEMLLAMFGDYVRYGGWLLLFAGYAAAGLGLFAVRRQLIKSGRAKKAGTYLLRALWLAGLPVLLRFCYGRGMFGFDYTDYFSMYKWVTVYLLVVIALCVWMLFHAGGTKTLKLWSVFALVTVFVTPLGSNNGLYPLINNLFLLAPVSVLLLAEAFGALGKTDFSFVGRATLCCIAACTAIQSLLFGAGFVFHDAKAAREPRAVLHLQSGVSADGLRTTNAKAASLQALDCCLAENGLTGGRVILYGDIPALAYIFDLEPAVFTTWPDLDSNAADRLEEDLAAIHDDRPAVILGAESVDWLTEQSGLRYQKLCAIQAFMKANDYVEIYSDEAYRVYIGK